MAGAVAIIAAAAAAYFTVLVAHRQRAVELILSAFADMEGGTQKRSAGIAALAVLRGDPMRRPRGYMNRRLWKDFGPGVGQALFRTQAYVLVEAERKSHGIENAISLMDWLLTDQVLQFNDPDQRRRLAAYADGYATKLSSQSSPNSAASAFVGKREAWTLTLIGVQQSKSSIE
jgi:hypothetical protein